MSLEPRQIRAARALLDWSQEDLSKACGIARGSIKNIENELVVARKDTLKDIREAFEQKGVEFLSGSGIRLRTQSITVHSGPAALEEFFDDVYKSMQSCKHKEIITSGADEKDYEDFDKALTEQHVARMTELDIVHKVLCRKGDSRFTTPYAQYRWVPSENYSGTPFYVYSDKLAIILWHPKLEIVVMQYPQLVDAYRKQFFLQWAHAEIPKPPTKAAD